MNSAFCIVDPLFSRSCTWVTEGLHRFREFSDPSSYNANHPVMSLGTKWECRQSTATREAQLSKNLINNSLLNIHEQEKLIEVIIYQHTNPINYYQTSFGVWLPLHRQTQSGQ